MVFFLDLLGVKKWSMHVWNKYGNSWQTKNSNAFSWTKMLIFGFRSQWRFFITSLCKGLALNRLQATGFINVDKGRSNTREYATHLVIFVDYFYFTNCFNHSSILVDFSTRFTTWGRRLVNNWHASNQTRKRPTMCYTSNFVFGLLHLTCT